jgi:exopolysaccharide biosynthesis polyprenyl glycosylphosphotransferase
MYKPFSNAEDQVVAVKGAYRTEQKGFVARFAQAEFENRFRKLSRRKYIDFVDTYSAGFKRDVFLALRGFDTRFPVANNEDVEFSYRMADHGHRMVFNPDAIVYHTHSETLLQYLRLKFGRAYWRVAVYHAFPGKMGRDSYTPQTLKVQILLMFLLAFCISGAPFLTPLKYVSAALAILFFLSTIPFLMGVLGLTKLTAPPEHDGEELQDETVEKDKKPGSDAPARIRGRVVVGLVEGLAGGIALTTRKLVGFCALKIACRCILRVAVFLVRDLIFRAVKYLAKLIVLTGKAIKRAGRLGARCWRATWMSSPVRCIRCSINWMATRRPVMAVLSVVMLALRGAVMGMGVLWGLQGHQVGRQGRFSHVFMLLLSDLGALSLSGVAGVFVRRRMLAAVLGEHSIPLETYLPLMLPSALFMVAIFFLSGLYRPYKGISRVNEFVLLFKVLTTIAVLALAMFYIAGSPFSRSAFVIAVFFALVSVSVFRAITRTLLSLHENGKERNGKTHVVIVGTGETARLVCRRLNVTSALGSDVMGFVHGDKGHEGEPLEGHKVLGDLSELGSIIEQYSVEEVFMCMPMLPQEDTIAIVDANSTQGVQFHMISNLFDLVSAELDIAESNSIPIAYFSNDSVKVLYLIVKRMFDIVFSALVILLTLPVWVMIMVAIRMETEGPAIFSQDRVGKDGKLFRVYKFRTMFSDTPEFEIAPSAPGDSRVTRVGRLLRKTSLDEFPQFLNVFRGDMSVVGPRPEMPFMVVQYKPWQRKRLTAKPGITGLWQIMGRKDLPLHESIEYDFYYIKNQSLLLDFTILMRTVPAVLFGRGAY